MKKFDLSERTIEFSQKVIVFLGTLPKDFIHKSLVDQALRCSTSIGANYMEADTAESRKDFIHKLGICKKEAKEARYWFQLIAKANPDKIKECRLFYKEANELLLIFSSIIRNSRNNSTKKD